MVTGAMNEIAQSGKMAEKQMIAHANGKVELVDVVTAVASAQSSLETAMAVRDQVIAAYQEIMRMPI
jgi:flagellar hook-basal body complex protein FliE